VELSELTQPEPVKFFIGAFAADPEVLGEVEEILAVRLGRVDWRSPPLMFDRTRYYEKEMGWPLHRRFFAFERLISPEFLVDIKLATHDIEVDYTDSGRRTVNIDPGYLCAERLVLATGKNYIHRIYLGKGVYADLTLVFSRGSFKILNWTYPDYAAPEMIGYFNELRSRYMTQLRASRVVDQVESTEEDFMEN
jgi:hypothetical protein